MRTCRFRFPDLLILSLLAVALTTFAIFVAARADDRNNRVHCASNLRQIGQAILLYSNENRGAYPRANYDADKADKPVAYTNPEAQPTEEEAQHDWRPPFVKAGPGPNDVTGALFLLLKTEDITPEVFQCPTAQAAIENPGEKSNPQKECNFSDPRQLSYSFANPYPTDAAVDAGYKLVNSMPPEFAIAADMNPGVDELLTTTTTAAPEAMQKVNSPNHGQDGQNVLYADGHVEFNPHPFCGMERDNIFTFGKCGETSGGEGIIGSPTSDKDSILLPTVKQAPATQPAK